MSIWHKEIVKVNGRLKAYVEVQNDFSGEIRGGLREIHEKDGKRTCIADGGTISLDDEYRNYARRESQIEKALKLYRDNSWIG